MKQTKTPTSKTRDEDFDRVVEDLGEDVVRQLHQAYKLTAAALYKRAVEKAEAQLAERQR